MKVRVGCCVFEQRVVMKNSQGLAVMKTLGAQLTATDSDDDDADAKTG